MRVCHGCGQPITNPRRKWCEQNCGRRDQRASNVVELAPYHWHKAPSVRLYLGALENREAAHVARDQDACKAADMAMGDALDLMRDDQGLPWEPRRMERVDEFSIYEREAA